MSRSTPRVRTLTAGVIGACLAGILVTVSPSFNTIKK